MTRRHVAWLCLLILVAVLLALAGRGVLAAPPLHPGRFGPWVERIGPAAAAMTLLRLAALGGALRLGAAVLVDGLATHPEAELRRSAALSLPRWLRANLRRAAGVGLAVSPLMLPAGLTTAAGAVRPGVVQGEPAPDDADPSAAPADGTGGVAILRPLPPAEGSTASTTSTAPPGSSTTTAPPGSTTAASVPSPARPATAPPSTPTSTTSTNPPATAPPPPTTAPPPPTTAAPPAAVPVRPSPQPDRAAATEEATIEAGDSLWRLAEGRLAELLGRAPSDAEIVPYWTAVIDANRALLRSGDPDVIYPGERIVLPAVR